MRLTRLFAAATLVSAPISVIAAVCGAENAQPGLGRARDASLDVSTTDASADSTGSVGANTHCPKGMLFIGGATLTLGTGSQGLLLGDVPLHSATIGPYCLDDFEMTNARYRKCFQAGSCPRRHEPCATHADQLPVTCIDWTTAKAACEFERKRLPTPDEWEFAARGSDGRIFPWGNGGSVIGLNLSTGGGIVLGGTHIVDVSPFGVHDLGANVLEWVQSQNSSTTQPVRGIRDVTTSLDAAIGSATDSWGARCAAQPLP